jgi:hypothetical protein
VIVRAVPSGTRDTHNKRVLWKTRTTRNFAGFPAFRHTLGIGRCCIARVLKPAERTAETGALIGPGLSGRGFFSLAQEKRETGVLIGTKSTHYPDDCRRHHDRAVTGLWLANLHDTKRGTS